MREDQIETYLDTQVKARGGQTRKVEWIGRRGAPDRFVMMPDRGSFWVECKNPATIKTFPKNGHEQLQQVEHDIMRRHGERVYLVGTKEEVDMLLDTPWVFAGLYYQRMLAQKLVEKHKEEFK